MSLATGTRLGAYEVLSPLGAGGMGEVYRARDSRLDREVALKVLPEELFEDADRVARFEREAKALAALNHQGIAAVYAFEEISGRHILVMELVEGDGLDARITTGTLSAEESLSIANQIAEALEVAHEKGIVHRDLKPANVMVTPEGRIKLLDFGLAKLFGGDGTPGSSPSVTHSPTLTARATAAGVILGTAAYMSPEQARGKAVDKRTDIWAFGCVLYEMLAGKRAFEGETVSDTLAAILMKEPDWSALRAPGVSSKVVDLLRRCLQRDAKQRLRDIGDARIALEEAHVQAPTPAAAGAASAVRSGASSSLTFEAAPGGALLRSKRSLYVPWAIAAVCAAAAITFAVSLLNRPSVPQAPLVRFPILPPENQKWGHSVSISPDGRRLALVTSGADGKNMIWIRPLDALSAQLVAGTEDARFPFWSPDSRSIGFFSDGKLKRTDLGGGPPVTLCDAEDGRGGAWGADGVILFSPSIRKPLYRVPSTGGAPSPVTTLDGANGDTSHRWPVFLPDGRTFLYLVYGPKREMGGIYAASLAQPVGRRVVESLGRPDFGSGHVLFIRDAILLAQPFDPVRLRTMGEPFSVVEDMRPEGDSGFTGFAPFSVSTTGILVSRVSKVPRTQLTWFDRGGSRLGTAGEPGILAEPALFPDGRRAAVTVIEPTTNVASLWTIDLVRGSLSRLTFGPTSTNTASVSPDGSFVVFTASSGVSGSGDIHRKRASGEGAEEILFNANGEKFLDQITPDGKYVLFEGMQAKTKSDVWAFPLSGDGKPVAVLDSPSNETHAAVSPDGHFIAYASDETGRPEIFVRRFPAGDGRWQISTAGGDQPQWRADGKELFFVSAGQKLTAVEVRTGAAFETGAAQALFDLKVPPNGILDYRNQYVAKADGSRFLVTALVGEPDTSPAVVVLNWTARAKGP